MSTVTSVTVQGGWHCDSCGWDNPGPLIAITCPVCFACIISFGPPKTREVEITVTENDDGSATIKMPL